MPAYVYAICPRTQVEYMLLKFDDKTERVQLSLMGPHILNTLQVPENSDPVHHQSKWRPEYASFMIEGMSVCNLLSVYNTIIVVTMQHPHKLIAYSDLQVLLVPLHMAVATFTLT